MEKNQKKISSLITNKDPSSIPNLLKSPADFLVAPNFLKPDCFLSNSKDEDLREIPKKTPPLLTPLNFLQCSTTNCIDNLIDNKNILGSLPKPSNQSSQYIDQWSLDRFSTSIDSTNNKQEISDKELSVQELYLSTSCIPSSSVRRKLNFEGNSNPVAVVPPLSSVQSGEQYSRHPKPTHSTTLEDAAKLLPEGPCHNLVTNSVGEASKQQPNNTQKKDSISVGGIQSRKAPLPPIGVFWDIENCNVPKGLSAVHVAQAIRSKFFDGFREAEFVCVCNTLKESPKVLEELNDAQVNVLHVGSNAKNAADDKLLQSMRRFADSNGPDACVILISGDADFATELYDLRYRKNFRIILVHNGMAQDSLKLSAHESSLFSEVTQSLPRNSTLPQSKPIAANFSRDLMVWNLPSYMDSISVKKRLMKLASSCGGKVIRVTQDHAKISFQKPDLAAKAKKRIDGENVFGSIVYCSFARPGLSLMGPYAGPSGALPVGPQQFKNPIEPALHGSTRRGGRMMMNRPTMSAMTNDQSNFNHFSCPPVFHIPYPSYNWERNSFGMEAPGPWRPQSPSNHSNLISTSYTAPPGSTLNGSSSSSREPSPQPLYLRRTPDYLSPANNQKPFNGIDSYHSTSVPVNDSYFHFQPPPPLLDSQQRNFSPSSQLWMNGEVPKRRWQQQPQQSSSLASINTNCITSQMGSLSLDNNSSQDNYNNCPSQSPVDLRVTNLDQNIDARDIKKILLAFFRVHVMVLHVSVFVQSDGTLAACVRVTSQHNAQYAISQLHRKKIGNKRIIISQISENSQPPEMLRAKVVNLLREIPGRKLLLFKFRELYERRYNETIGVPELYSMKDIVTVSDNSTGRTIYLHSDLQHNFSLSLTDPSLQDPNELRYCKLHSSGPDHSVGWAERDHTSILPDVNMTLKDLGHGMNILLESHGGDMPLASLVECYQTEVGPLAIVEEGVSLEHLVSCLSWVNIYFGPGGFKYIQWKEMKDIDDGEDLSRFISPPLLKHLALFSKELVELLKTFPYCKLPLSRFIPAYHHHFGRQCRVADYGFTKLVDLFDTLPHVVQILGEGNKRIITLVHKTQVKRFSSDLLRVLKSQPSKIISLDAFPEAYKKILEKPWNVFHYGVCDIEDLFSHIGETTVIISKSGPQVTVAIPKREQTPDEIERTRQFSWEVVELLRHSMECKMQFNRFIPAYHHHFGRQCRVASYGFTKLVELFEAIPDVLQILDNEEDGGKMLQLIDKERLKVLGEQIVAVVKSSPNQVIGIPALSRVFTRYYGFSLKPEHYSCASILELLRKLRNYIQVVESENEVRVALVDRTFVTELWDKTRTLLWDESSCSLSVKNFIQKFSTRFNENPQLDILRKDLEDVKVEGSDEDGVIRLVPTQIFARDLITILHEAGGRMLLMNLETAYLDRFGIACRPAACGFPNLLALMQSLKEFVTIKGRGAKRILVLNKDFTDVIPKGNSQPSLSAYGKLREPDQFCSMACNPIQIPPPPSLKGNFAPHTLPPPQSPDCKLNSPFNDPPNSHILMGLTPSPQPSRYQPPSPLIYPGSPVNTNGSVIWSQLWSPPPYSVIPSMSPHYMVPSVPINWGGLGHTIPPSPATTPVSQKSGIPKNTSTPISIHTLDQFEKQIGPPNPCELPNPELLTQTPLSTNGSSPSKASVQSSLLGTPSNSAKKRLAAQFDAKEN